MTSAAPQSKITLRMYTSSAVRLRLLLRHCRLLVTHIGQRKILSRRIKQHHRLLNMHIGIEFFSLRHGFALERWFERTQIAKIHNVAVCHDVAGNLSGIVQHGFHFLTIECGGLCHTLAETAKIHTVSARRLGNLNSLSAWGPTFILRSTRTYCNGLFAIILSYFPPLPSFAEVGGIGCRQRFLYKHNAKIFLLLQKLISFSEKAHKKSRESL